MAKGRGSSDRDEKLAGPMRPVLPDQLISQSLMFSLCGSHGREMREKEKGIKANLRHALITTFCIKGCELCVCSSVFYPLNLLKFNEFWQWYRVFRVSLSSISFIKSSQVEDSEDSYLCL